MGLHSVRCTRYMQNILSHIRIELHNRKDDKTREMSQRFFKEEIKCYGVKMPVVHKISKEFFKHIQEGTREEVFQLCEKLWQSGYLEESIIACNWSYYMREKYIPVDFRIFEKWINSYVNNWASCDTFCNHTIGEFIQIYPEYINELKQFASSENRWLRRAAAVSLIIPARRGKFLKDIFEIAGTLLLDKDDLVQKGYGWMLKAASEPHQKEVFEFVQQKKVLMPRTALRYAIEKMPTELKRLAMAK